MTTPGGIIPFPAMNVGSTGVINDPGDGAHMASALANFLAYQQQQKENQQRQMMLQNQMQQQQALAQYYEGTVSNESRRVSDEEAKTRAKIKADREIGTALQGGRAPGIPSASQPGQAGGALQPPPPMQPGNATQAGPGLTAQQGMAAPPAPQLGNTTQAGGGLLSQAAGMMQSPQPPDTPGMINPDTSSPFHQIVNGASQALAPNGDLSGYQAMFGQVSPENVPGLIDEATKLRELQKPLETTPDLQQNYMFAQTLPEPYKSQFLDLLRKQGGGNTFNLGDKVQLAGAQEYQKNSADELNTSEKEALGQVGTLPGIKESYNLVTNDKVFMGIMAKPTLALARMADAWGVTSRDEHQKIIGTQTLINQTGQQVLALLGGHALGSGNAISNKDLEFMQKIVGQDIALNKETLQKTFRIIYGSGIWRMKQAVDRMHDFADSNQQVSKDVLRRASRLEGQMAPKVADYAKMLLREGVAIDGEDGIASLISGLPGAEATLRSIRQQAQQAAEAAQKTAGQIGWQTAAPQ